MSSDAVYDTECADVFNLPHECERQRPAPKDFSRQFQRELQYEVRSLPAHDRRGAAKERLRCLSQLAAETRGRVINSNGSRGSHSVLHLPHSERASEWTRPRVVQDVSRTEIVRANSDQCRRVWARLQSRATRPAPTARLRGLSQLHRGIAATPTGQFNARPGALSERKQHLRDLSQWRAILRRRSELQRLPALSHGSDVPDGDGAVARP